MRTKDAQTFLTDMTDRIQEKRLHGKVEELDKENTRLRAQVQVLSGDLKHERDEHEELVDLLKARPTKETVKMKRKGGLLRVLAIGGAAYVLGAKAGKERYDQIKGWFTNMRERAAGAGQDTMSSMTDASDTRVHDSKTMKDPGST